MKPKRQRLLLVLLGLGFLGISVGLVLAAFDEGVTFFYSPSDLHKASAAEGRPIRVGGLVESGSLIRGSGIEISFRVTDLKESVAVSYRGILPDLFREGQGVVVLGTLSEGGHLEASEVLAKHDETYMPAEVAEALKASGQWQGSQGR